MVPQLMTSDLCEAWSQNRYKCEPQENGGIDSSTEAEPEAWSQMRCVISWVVPMKRRRLQMYLNSTMASQLGSTMIYALKSSPSFAEPSALRRLRSTDTFIVERDIFFQSHVDRGRSIISP